MQHISGISRQQVQLSSLEDKITLDNPVRFIEAFVEHISFELLGFKTRILKSEGRLVLNQKYFLNFIFIDISMALEVRES